MPTINKIAFWINAVAFFFLWLVLFAAAPAHWITWGIFLGLVSYSVRHGRYIYGK